MEFELTIDFGESKKEKLDNILIIDELPDEVIDTINTFEVCGAPLFYSGDKTEMLSFMQPKSIDIAIYKLPIIKNEKRKTDYYSEVEFIVEALAYRCSLYVVDIEANEDYESIKWSLSYLHKKGFEEVGRSYLLGNVIIEMSRGMEYSIKDCFNPSFNGDVSGVIFASSIRYDSIVYCDVPEFIDMFYYASKNDKNVFMALPIEQMEYITNYLLAKEPSTQKINKDKQFELF